MDFPQDLEIETSTHCNAACGICPSRLITREPMSIDLWRKIIDDCKGHGLRTLHPFLYGEPLMDKRLWKMLDYANKVLPKTTITIYTNGSLLTEAFGQRLIDRNLGYIAFSIDSLDAAMYEELRPGLNLSKTTANVLNFLGLLARTGKDYKVFTRVNAVVTRDNLNEAVPIQQFWSRFVDEVSVGADDGRIRLADPTGLPSLRQEVTWACEGVGRMMIILSNGDVVPCCKDWAGLTVLGNVRTQSVQEIWQSVPFQELRAKVVTHDFRGIAACEACLNSGFVFRDVDGYLGPEEGTVLYQLAHGNVVEIGSYKGKSTLCLAQGVRDKGGHVYAIDYGIGTPGEPHDEGYIEEFLTNIEESGLESHVTFWESSSEQAAHIWEVGHDDETIDFLFIDGDHDQAQKDVALWADKASVVALHDNDRQDVGVAILKMVNQQGWKILGQVGCTTVLAKESHRG